MNILQINWKRFLNRIVNLLGRIEDMKKPEQLEIFPKKFIVEVWEKVEYKFEVEAKDGWDAQKIGKQMVEDWNGSNTKNIITRYPFSCTQITDERGVTNSYSD